MIKVHPRISHCVRTLKPVVALETTIITHGLPYPKNFETAMLLEQAVRDEGAVPATIGVVDGVPCVGIECKEMEELSQKKGEKIQAHTLAWAMVKGISGGTTVSASIHLAHLVGIKVFATGGIGGVHRGEDDDVSQDLKQLANTPIALVSAGAKAILDLPRTLEMLETLGVLTIGFQTEQFPAFYTAHSGLSIPRVESEQEVTQIMQTTWGKLNQNSAILICNPPPKDKELEASFVDRIIHDALKSAQKEKIRGKGLTPFLMEHLEKKSGGKTVETNVALAESNARLAARIAVAYSG